MPNSPTLFPWRKTFISDWLRKRAAFDTWKIAGRAAMFYRLAVAGKPRLVAVVGSQGKTTTARAVAAALGLPEHPGRGCNEFSFVARAVFRVRPWHDHAVVEVGIGRRGQMRRYARVVRPDVTVVTSVSSEHHRSLETLAVTRAEKAEMVAALPPAGLAVLNGDDANVLWMRERTRAPVVTYGFAETNEIRATEAALCWPEGTRFRLQARGAERDVLIRLIGRAFIYPVLAAVAVGLAAGLDLDLILERLAQLPPTPERLEPVRLSSGAILLRDEIKSSVETIDVALDALAGIPARRKIVVLGDVSEPPGSASAVYRRLGARVAAAANFAIFLSMQDQAYAAGASRAGMPREAMVKAGRNLRRALAAIPADLGTGDVVLVKGRDNQRLGRISLALMGCGVRCNVQECRVLYSLRCGQCKMLGRERE